MIKKLTTFLLIAASILPMMAQEGKSYILIHKNDGNIDTLLLNNVREMYHSCVDINGVKQQNVSTLRLRTVAGERVYPLQEIDHVVMPKHARIVSFNGLSNWNGNIAGKTSVSGNFPGDPGDIITYGWVRGDHIFLSSGDKSNDVSIPNDKFNGSFSFRSDTLVADQYTVYYAGQNAAEHDKVTIPDTQTQSFANNSDHLGVSGDCGTAIATRQANSDYTFALDHKSSVICFMPRIDTLNTVRLRQVAIKTDKNIAGTFILSPEGLSLVNGTGKDSITLNTGDFILPHQKSTAQDSVASYMVVAPQDGKTNISVYYRVYDTRSEIDTTVVKKVAISNIDKAKVYPITSIIPVRTFMSAFTDGAEWDFDCPATLHGSVNLPVSKVGIIWGYNKNLNFDTMSENISLTHDDNYKFQATPIDKVLQKAYYYRAYADWGGRTLFGKVRKFGMEREIVDLGTSVRWSSINMGAITAEDCGNYYAWGETETKDSYTLANYTHYHDNSYASLGADICGNPQYDVVAKNWRGCWRMPRKSELDEINSMCTWTWTEKEGQGGFTVKNKTDDNSSIFIPAAGYMNGGAKSYPERGYYQSGTEYSTSSEYCLYFYNNYHYSNNHNISKYYGSTIRPVFDSNIETDNGVYLYVSTDKIDYSDDHTSTNMYGTMRGMDDVVTDITEGFVIGTSADVTLESDEAVLQTTLSQLASDNGSYNLPLSAEDMDKLTLGQTYYVRAFITYDGSTYYGDALTMDAMTITTDKTDWKVGDTTTTLYGTATGITESAAPTVELGFVVGDNAEVTLDNGTELVSSHIGNGVFTAEFADIELKQYYYRAFIRQGGRVFYGEPKMLGLEMVDLGLPSGLRWANINVGSQTPMDNGDFFSWGETTAKTTYYQSNYTYYKNNAYVNIGSDINGTIYDAAQVNWQSVWRMPTKADMQELIDNCTWTSTTLYGKKGYLLTSKNNGKTIFLPFTGYRINSGHNDANARLLDWCSELSKEDAGHMLDSYGSKFWINGAYRFYGLTVRPVARYNQTTDDGSMIQLSTDSVTWNVGETSATLHGYLLGLRYNESATESGFAYATVPGISEKTEGVQFLKTNEGETSKVASGKFSAIMPSVQDETIYYYRAYVKVGEKYYFAEEREFGRKTVDLGLPSGTLWSNINLGGSSIDDSGDYYAWGETATKSDYSKATYSHENLPVDISGTIHDAAHVNWGGLWRMPTRDDFMELIAKCTWTEVSLYGRSMYKITGPNNECIYIAKRGFMNGTSIAGDNERASIWTSILDNKLNVDNANAFGSNFHGNDRDIDKAARYLGYAVRPVKKFTDEIEGTRVYLSTDGTDWQVGMRDVNLFASVAGITDMSNVKLGFIVGTTPELTASTEGAANLVATTPEDTETFSVTTTYDTDMTYYYRAYVKYGDNYCYGNVRRYGLELVDMGNNVKWASINLGAQTSSDYGNRYAWGETSTKSNYSESTYSYYENGYEDIGSDISSTRYDAVKKSWGGTWRMPTVMELRWLIDNCEWEWTEIDGQTGYKVTSTAEGCIGNSIFLPASGSQDGSYYENLDTKCQYWTSSLYDNSSSYMLDADAQDKTTGTIQRFIGAAIRPVTTTGSEEGGGGDITGGHNPGGSEQTGGDGEGSGGAGSGNTGGVIGN